MASEIFVMLTLLAETMMILKCLHVSFNEKMRFDKYTVGIVVITCVFYLLVNAGIISQIYSIAVYILIGVFCYIRFKTSIGATIGRFVVGLTIAGLIEVVVACLAVPLQTRFDMNIIMILSSAVSLALAYICPILVKVFSTKIATRRSKNMLGATVLYGIALVILLVDYYRYKATINLYAVVVMMFSWLICIFAHMLEQTKNEIEKKELQIELQKIYGGAYTELLEEVRKRQHDFKNQLSAIYSMHLVAHSLEELVAMQKEYGDKLIEECRFDSILLSCSNPILAGYIYYKCIACEKDGISISYSIQLEEAKCCFPLHEIIEILGVLIDNACENALAGDVEAKFLRLNFREEREKIIFSVSNPNRYLKGSEIENLFQKGYSTKGKNRGIGLARVRELVRQHETEIRVSNDTFDDKNWIDFTVIATK